MAASTLTSMARYLLVLSKATSLPALIVRAQLLAAEQARTTFVLITPLPRATQDRDVAEHLASANDMFAVAQLRRARLRVERSEIGDRAPLMAIADELRAHPNAYDALDDHWRAESLPVPVIHVFEKADVALPPPLTYRARRVAAGPAGIIRWVVRLLQRPRLGIAVMMAPMITYLTIGAVLAVFVDRRFVINEILAVVFYSALVTMVIFLERSQEPSNPRIEDMHHGRRLKR